MKAMTISQIEEGCGKILENAHELIDDAELLLKKKRFSRAYFLAHLACEEMAKVPMLIGAAVDLLSGRRINWSALHHRLHSHTEKIMGILVLDYFADHESEESPDMEKLKEDLERTKDYKQLKERSIYTGLVDDRFQKPSEVIPAELAENIVALARDRLNFFEALNLPKEGKLAETLESPLFRDLSEQFIDPLRKNLKRPRK